jgi:hypothetical protein
MNGTALENAPFESVFRDIDSQHRFARHLPVQVQSCWNGIAILDPAPMYAHPHVRFRMANLGEGECSASECSLMCVHSAALALLFGSERCRPAATTTGRPATVASCVSSSSSLLVSNERHPQIMVPRVKLCYDKVRTVTDSFARRPHTRLVYSKSGTLRIPTDATSPSFAATHALAATPRTRAPIRKIAAGCAGLQSMSSAVLRPHAVRTARSTVQTGRERTHQFCPAAKIRCVSPELAFMYLLVTSAQFGAGDGTVRVTLVRAPAIYIVQADTSSRGTGRRARLGDASGYGARSHLCVGTLASRLMRLSASTAVRHDRTFEGS